MSRVPAKFRPPPLYERLRRSLQEFVDNTVDYLTNQPRFEIIELTMTDTDDDIRRSLDFVPTGLLILRSQRTDTTAVAENLDLFWEPDGKGIKIKDLIGAASSQKYLLTILVTGSNR